MAIDLQRDLGHVQVNKNSVKHAKPPSKASAIRFVLVLVQVF